MLMKRVLRTHWRDEMRSGRSKTDSRLNDRVRGIIGLILVALASSSNAAQPADCKFTDLDLPADFAVLAGGEYSGRRRPLGRI
jgi:hypothetical protein